jgi:hypothetical protein
VIPAVRVAPAALTFFFDVGDFTPACDFAVAANHASTVQISIAEKPNETHECSHNLWGGRAMQMPPSSGAVDAQLLISAQTWQGAGGDLAIIGECT